MTDERVEWVDYGKGISILLVLLHHVLAQGTDPVFLSPALNAFNELMIFVRIPFFFLMAGMFARKSIEGPLREFVGSKVLNLLYLYTLWSTITYALTILLPYVLFGVGTKKLYSIFFLFIEPPKTLWFLYAMAIFFAGARASRSLPRALIAALAFAIYAESIGSGRHATLAFSERLARFFPFFLAGVYWSPTLKAARPRRNPWLLAALPAYVLWTRHLLSNGLLFSEMAVGSAQLLGVAAAIVGADFLAAAKLLPWLRRAGAESLPIYVTHRVVLFGADKALHAFPLGATFINIAAAWVLCASLPVLLARALRRRGVGGVYEMPKAWRLRNCYDLSIATGASSMSAPTMTPRPLPLLLSELGGGRTDGAPIPRRSGC